jgi:hypothetical protein
LIIIFGLDKSSPYAFIGFNKLNPYKSIGVVQAPTDLFTVLQAEASVL